MKNIVRIIILVISFVTVSKSYAQREIAPSHQIRIFGTVEKEMTYSEDQLDTMLAFPIRNLPVVNHKGEFKDSLKGLMGIPVKKLLAPIKFNYTKPKELNEFYFIFKGTDGYRVVFSWNELYNSPVGNECFILQRVNQLPLSQQSLKINLVSTADLGIGRRYLKGLESIEVCRLP